MTPLTRRALLRSALALVGAAAVQPALDAMAGGMTGGASAKNSWCLEWDKLHRIHYLTFAHAVSAIKSAKTDSLNCPTTAYCLVAKTATYRDGILRFRDGQSSKLVGPARELLKPGESVYVSCELAEIHYGVDDFGRIEVLNTEVVASVEHASVYSCSGYPSDELLSCIFNYRTP